MKKMILTIFAATALGGSMIQAASANEHHHKYIRTSGHAARVAAPSYFNYPPSYLNSNAEFRDPNAYGWSYPRSYWRELDEGAMSSGPAGH